MGAHKDRLIQAADLLGMTPDELTSRLDNPLHRDGLPFADGLLRIGRERRDAILDASRVDPEDARTLARVFRELDIHLSAGGAPPEVWREGPDAPESGDAGADREKIRSDEVYRFTLANPEDEPEHVDDLMRQRHNGADVLVLGVGIALAEVEALDGTTFRAWHHELTDVAATEASRFASHATTPMAPDVGPFRSLDG